MYTSIMLDSPSKSSPHALDSICKRERAMFLFLTMYSKIAYSFGESSISVPARVTDYLSVSISRSAHS